MKRRNQFVPSVERLEQLFLLAVINRDVANFAGNLVYDSSGTTPHTVYGFPGMSFTVQANCPTIQWTGYQSVTYTSSSNILASGPQVSDGTDGRPRQRTQYDTTIGIAIPFSTWTTTAAPGFYTNTRDQQLFSLPKDNSSYTMTISVDIVAYQYVMGGVPPTDTSHDQLTIIVEPITLNPTSGTSGIVLPSLLITDASGPTEAAFPLWFGTTQASDPNIIDPNGTNLSFLIAGGTTTIPFTQKGAGYWANVTNNTHYSLKMGYIQVIDFSYQAFYTDGITQSASGTNVLDLGDGVTDSYWYYKQVIDRGATDVAVPGVAYTTAQDSPAFAPMKYDETQGRNKGWVYKISMSIDVRTSLVVAGGSIPGGNAGSPDVVGVPIALSTATWFLKGSATNGVNAANFAGANQSTTENWANWTYQLASGAGASPATLPPVGTNPGRWYAVGDDVVKYLNWNSNAAAVRQAGNLKSVKATTASTLAAPLEPVASLMTGDSLGKKPAPSRLATVAVSSRAQTYTAWDRALELGLLVVGPDRGSPVWTFERPDRAAHKNVRTLIR